MDIYSLVGHMDNYITVEQYVDIYVDSIGIIISYSDIIWISIALSNNM
jgi:hypothetical protein